MDGSMKFRGNGKLMITGEYVVLDGASALALPTKFGQNLTIKPVKRPGIEWTSRDHNGNVWIKKSLKLQDLEDSSSNNPGESDDLLLKLLRSAFRLNPAFVETSGGFECVSELEFPGDWGLGSSSTLIHNIAAWAGVDPFTLSDKTLGGSGYDIAAAGQSDPILYNKRNGSRQVRPVKLVWDFTDELFFVHLNRKQDSREAIAQYRNSAKRAEKDTAIKEISTISESLPGVSDFDEFKKLLETHDEIISAMLKIPTVGKRLFPDFRGIVKSLGAWGGDFVMVSGKPADQNYFRNKGYDTIIPFREMII